MGCNHSIPKKQPLDTKIKQTSLTSFTILRIPTQLRLSQTPEVMDVIVTNNVKLGMIVCIWCLRFHHLRTVAQAFRRWFTVSFADKLMHRNNVPGTGGGRKIVTPKKITSGNFIILDSSQIVFIS